MKKIVALLIAILMVASVLVACGGNGGSGGGSGEKASSITVNIWDSNQQKGIQEIADKWTETSGVKVNVEVVDWNNYWTLLEAGASGGTMPDVFWMHSNTVQMYMENDILLDLTDYIEKDSSIDMSKYYEGVKDQNTIFHTSSGTSTDRWRTFTPTPPPRRVRAKSRTAIISACTAYMNG